MMTFKFKRIRWNNVIILLLVFTSMFLWIDGQGLRRERNQLSLSNNMYQLDNERLAEKVTSTNEHLRGYEIRIANLEDELKALK